MLPGKKYTPEDVLAIARRRMWWLLVPLAVIGAAAAMYARTLPPLYRSQTLILVVPQRIAETYVRATVTTRIEDRLQSISQQILSRTRLERIIQDFNLYAGARRNGIMEDIVQRMRRDINVQVQRGDAFTVSYVGNDPRVVMQVTDRLASFFIEESLRDRAVLAEGTNQFLEAQLEEARRRLIDHEKKLEDYRKRYSGQLPSQVESNLRAVSSLQVQMQSVLERIDGDQDRRLLLEQHLAELEGTSSPEVGPVSAATVPGSMVEGVPASGSASDQLRAARAQVETQRLRLKSDHPDMIRMERVIKELEAKVEAEQSQVPLSADAGRSPVEMARERRARELREELDKIDRSIKEARVEETRLRGLAAEYQGRAESAPTRESELVELTRDYIPLQNLYSSLLGKKEDARISANLEQRNIGEQFRLLDPANLPERPFSPDRPQMTMYGIVLGLAFGVACVGLLEYRDRSFKTDDELMTVLALPVLAVVPRMRSEPDRRRERKRRILSSLVLGTTVAGCLAVLVYTYLR